MNSVNSPFKYPLPAPVGGFPRPTVRLTTPTLRRRKLTGHPMQRSREVVLQEITSFDAQACADSLLDQHAVLVAKISAAVDCPREEVRIALREALRFMQLAAANDQGKLTPSVRVDLAWHEFILCTKAYHEFCIAQFGRMVHHFPGGDSRQNEAQFRLTLRRYEQTFGPPPSEYWRAGESCGLCDG